MYRLTIALVGAAAFFLPLTIAGGTAITNSSELASAAPVDEARQLQILQQLHPVNGDVAIPGANAVLHLGQDFYFLPASEARLVLTEGWGNPPDEANGLLGMVLPAGSNFMDDTWGALITYEAGGHVSDSDAATLDHDAILAALRGDEAALNAERAAQGFPATHLIGWAQRPAYDSRSHSVVWARNLEFAGNDENTLTYSMRLLGRRGALGIDMVTAMSKLGETREAGRRLLASAEFVPGERYADFRRGTDPIAGYGIAGLIAASVGATIPVETDLSGLLLPMLAIFAVTGLALFWPRIRDRFSDRSAGQGPAYAETPRPPSSAG